MSTSMLHRFRLTLGRRIKITNRRYNQNTTQTLRFTNMKTNQPTTVQDALIATLRGYGITKSTATQIARVLQANPTARSKDLSREEHEQLFQKLLASIDFQTLGLNENAAADLRQKLLNKYKSGLDGDLEGPFNYGPQSDSTWDETVSMLQSSSQEEWEQRRQTDTDDADTVSPDAPTLLVRTPQILNLLCHPLQKILILLIQLRKRVMTHLSLSL